MSDKINIVMHPGYCITQENYNKEIYFEQLDKGQFNVFLHPTLSNQQIIFLLNKEFNILKKYAKHYSNINDTIDICTNNEYIQNEGKYIHHPYAANLLRQFMFSIIRRVKKNRKIKNKKFTKYFNKILNLKKKNLIKYLIHLSNMGYPIFSNHLIGKEYKEYNKSLRERYTTKEGQINIHADCTIITPSIKKLVGYIKEHKEETDEVYLFGEHFNQCVQNIANIMDEVGLEYTILKELTSYNNRELQKCNEKDNHFFILEE